MYAPRAPFAARAGEGGADAACCSLRPWLLRCDLPCRAQERDLDVWRRVRSCYKAVAQPKKLETEMPDNQFAALAMHYIKQVRARALLARRLRLLCRAPSACPGRQ